MPVQFQAFFIQRATGLAPGWWSSEAEKLHEPSQSLVLKERSAIPGQWCAKWLWWRSICSETALTQEPLASEASDFVWSGNSHFRALELLTGKS